MAIRSVTRLFLAASALSSVTMAAPAWAQDSDSSGAATGDIVVTARRVEEVARRRVEAAHIVEHRVGLRRRPPALEIVRAVDGLIEIEPQPLPVKLQRQGRLLVAQPVTKVPALKTPTVERTRRDLAKRRGGR